MHNKTIKLLSLILIFAIALAGCGNGADIDPAELAKTLATGLSYDDPLSEIPKEDISLYMDLPENAEASFYKSGGSTSEAVCVVSCKNSEDAKQANDALNTYIEEQKTLFEAYDAQETDRLSKSVLVQKGNTVAMCICADADAAKKLIDEAAE